MTNAQNVKKLRTAEPQPIFTGSYKKKQSVPAQCQFCLESLPFLSLLFFNVLATLGFLLTLLSKFLISNLFLFSGKTFAECSKEGTKRIISSVSLQTKSWCLFCKGVTCKKSSVLFHVTSHCFKFSSKIYKLVLSDLLFLTSLIIRKITVFLQLFRNIYQELKVSAFTL